MSLSLQGLERYQTHQQLSHLDTPNKAAEAGKAAENASGDELADDDVSLSEGIVIMEWIASNSPNLSVASGNEAANLSRLSERLLRYDLISVPEAGRLMSLATPAQEQTQQPEVLNEQILHKVEHSETRSERQQWQKLGRLVSTLSAAQHMQ
ncbi:hypothetical protein BGP77_09280 [Saccharospirillum sp. MSK14-1]|uniref:hypothetical protein n=1 Tax=Saccharospirillum sp. MSK14-1 TaxID=1897632 RepID=UPI000D376BA7|nr:hypothetical protein [Saccharospirillum sp. MSK14-1]PTY38938.1 hypothetical protein BGP77_09280 [Saccharospirillum sp. MSK14-1]